MSLGLGQIKQEAAFAVEPLLAKIEKRPRRGQAEIQSQILTPLGSLQYGAAIIRSCQLAYEAEGFDVKNDPKILATLYNLGNCETRAHEAKQGGRGVRPNFFGVFVGHYGKTIDQIVDSNRPFDPAETAKLLNSDMHSDKPIEFQKSLNKPISLTSMPPQCETSDGPEDAYSRKSTLQRGQALGEAPKGDYNILSGSVDCDLQDWSLVRTATGQTGWVPSDVLSQRSSDRPSHDSGFFAFLHRAPTCDGNAARECLQKIKTASDNHVFAASSSGLLEIKLVGSASKLEEPHTSGFRTFCLRKQNAAIRLGNVQSMIAGKDAEALVERVEAKKSEIIRVFNLQSWSDPKNTFANKFTFEPSLQTQCQPACAGDLQMMEALLSEDFAKYKGYAGYKAFADKDYQISPFSRVHHPERPGDVPRADDTIKNYFDELDERCGKAIEKSPSLKANVRSLRRKFESAAAVDSTWRPELFRFVDDVNSPITLCKILDLGAPPDSSTEAQRCAQCEKSLAVNLSGRDSLDATSLRGVLRDDDDISNALQQMLQSLEEELPRPRKNKECTYDPMASAKRIQSVLNLDCVESVFVPEPFLLNSVSSGGDKAVLRKFDDDDRFAVRLKDDCVSETKAK